MKKIEKYISFLPFAISIGALVIYLFYTLKIRFSKRVIVTNELTNTLKMYLIIALVSLLIGLIIRFIQKIINLKNNNYETKFKIIKLNIINFNILGNKLTGKIKDTNEDIEIIFDKEIKFGIKCPECCNEISKDAALCPHCGILFDKEVVDVLNKKIKIKNEKIKLKKHRVIANILLIIIFIVLVLLVSNLLVNKAMENKNNLRPVINNKKI